MIDYSKLESAKLIEQLREENNRLLTAIKEWKEEEKLWNERELEYKANLERLRELLDETAVALMQRVDVLLELTDNKLYSKLEQSLNQKK